MVSFPELGFLLGVDRGMAHLMAVSPAGVEVVAGKVHRKVPVVAGCSDGGGRFQCFL